MFLFETFHFLLQDLNPQLLLGNLLEPHLLHAVFLVLEVVPPLVVVLL